MGVLTATPVLSVVDSGQLASYGVRTPDPVVTAVLQHRGVLQLALGTAIAWAALDRRIRVPILFAATATKGGGSVLLTLIRPEVRAAAPRNIGTWFDRVCLGLLPLIAIATEGSSRPALQSGHGVVR